MSSFFAGWCVVYTRPRHEKKAADKLSSFQIESYLPTKRELRVWCDRKKYIDAPLFPSYVFVYLKDMKDYYNGLNNDSVLGYVRSGKQIARVDEAIINNIRLIVDGKHEVEVTNEYFYAGKRLTIQDGPFKGISCEVVQWKGRENIIVRVNLMNRALLVYLPQEQLM